MQLAELAPICAIVFAAVLVRSTIGFGEAVVGMPLLALLVPVQFAAPLMALVSVCNGLMILVREWRHINFRAAARLIVPAVITVPIGALVLEHGDERIVKAVLAAIIFSYAVWSLRGPSGPTLETDRWAPVAGIIGGLLGGAYNASGPPVVVYGTLRRWSPERFRGMLQSYFIVGSLWIVSVHALNGLMTRDVLTSFAVCLPVIALASLLGYRMSRLLSPSRFVVAVHLTLIVVAAILLVSAVRSPIPS